MPDGREPLVLLIITFCVNCKFQAPDFVNYKKGCTQLAAASDKVYQLLAHGRWFSPACSSTKTGRHDIAESGVRYQKSINQSM